MPIQCPCASPYSHIWQNIHPCQGNDDCDHPCDQEEDGPVVEVVDVIHKVSHKLRPHIGDTGATGGLEIAELQPKPDHQG